LVQRNKKLTLAETEMGEVTKGGENRDSDLDVLEQFTKGEWVSNTNLGLVICLFAVLQCHRKTASDDEATESE
jgi:hypothetical protein